MFTVGAARVQTVRKNAEGRAISSGNAVHGGTIAMQQHLSPETTVSGRMTLSSQGQSTLSVQTTSCDRMVLRWSFLLPLAGWLWDKVTKRGAEDF
jgi:hypothetical protein